MNELVNVLERLASLRATFMIWNKHSDLVKNINDCMKVIMKIINEQIEEAQNET